MEALHQLMIQAALCQPFLLLTLKSNPGLILPIFHLPVNKNLLAMHSASAIPSGPELYLVSHRLGFSISIFSILREHFFVSLF